MPQSDNQSRFTDLLTQMERLNPQLNDFEQQGRRYDTAVQIRNDLKSKYRSSGTDQDKTAYEEASVAVKTAKAELDRLGLAYDDKAESTGWTKTSAGLVSLIPICHSRCTCLSRYVDQTRSQDLGKSVREMHKEPSRYRQPLLGFIVQTLKSQAYWRRSRATLLSLTC
jgi:hypothetical protein